MKKKNRIKKVRASHLNEVLRGKRSEKHEEKHGDKAKRARRKKADKQLMEE